MPPKTTHAQWLLLAEAWSSMGPRKLLRSLQKVRGVGSEPAAAGRCADRGSARSNMVFARHPLIMPTISSTCLQEKIDRVGVWV